LGGEEHRRREDAGRSETLVSHAADDGNAVLSVIHDLVVLHCSSFDSPPGRRVSQVREGAVNARSDHDESDPRGRGKEQVADGSTRGRDPPD
jgi:hypothetical protein